MSQHRFHTEYQGAAVRVTLGYDRPLRQYFLNVDRLNAEGNIDYSDTDEADEADEGSDEADQGGSLYVSLYDLEAPKDNLDYFRRKLCSLGLNVPETMFAAVENDRKHNVGNKVVNYEADGSDDQGPACLRLGQYDSPRGTTHVFRRFYSNGAIAIELCYEGEELTDTLSVNLVDAAGSLGTGEFFVENWGTNEVLIAPALASGLFEDTDRRSPCLGITDVRAPIWRIRQPAASTPQVSSST